jgi:hypothetical protein
MLGPVAEPVAPQFAKADWEKSVVEMPVLDLPVEPPTRANRRGAPEYWEPEALGSAGEAEA